MILIPGPTAEEQVAFLGKIERLLSEGQFVATYKYALLVAIADLAIKYGRDDGGELDLPIRAIAEEFIELYWRQGAPYGSAVADGSYNTLHQNTGRQAAILSIVGMLRESHGTLTRAKQSPAWTTTVTEAARLVTDMPLWRLQRLRSEVLDFLYAESPVTGNIRLKSGVAANLRRFHGIIVRLAQSEWMHFIQALPGNSQLLGPTSDLGRSLVPTGQHFSAWPHPSPMSRKDNACTASDEWKVERSITLSRGHATRVTLRITWYWLIGSAIAKRATCWPPKRILIDGC